MSPRVPSAERNSRLGYAVARLLRGDAVTVDDLKVIATKEDERTLRRDLSDLAQLRTRKTRGQLAPASTYYYEVQRTKNLPEKRAVAEGARRFFDPSASIAATAGSTVELTVAELMESGISPALVTNALAIAELAPAQAYFVPGNYSADIHALVGMDTVAAFRAKVCRQGIVGVSGVRITDGPDGQIGLYVRHADEMPVLQALVESVSELLVIVTNVQKLGRSDPWQFATIQSLSSKRRVVLVTNRCDDWKSELANDFDNARRTRDALRECEPAGKSDGRPFSLVEVPRELRKP